MKLPRDVSGVDLWKLLAKRGFEVMNRKGSHITVRGPRGEEAIIPLHNRLKVGTLSTILKRLGIDPQDLFGR